MTSVYLVRHAQATGNVEKRFQGHTDHTLTPTGIRQVRFVAARFQALPIHAVYTSPLQRAVMTAAGIASFHKLRPMWETGLIEIDGGFFENRLFDDLLKEYPTLYKAFLEDPERFEGHGGETFQQVCDRMEGAVYDIVRKNPDRSVVLVSHGCAIRCALCALKGLPLSRIDEIPWTGNTSVSHLLFSAGKAPRLAYLGNMDHLPEALH